MQLYRNKINFIIQSNLMYSTHFKAENSDYWIEDFKDWKIEQQ